MTSDALWVMDMIQLQKEKYINEMMHARGSNFDKYSYSIFAIDEALDAINNFDESASVIRVVDIAMILEITYNQFAEFYTKTRNNKDKYYAMKNAIEPLYEFAMNYLGED